MVSLSRSEAAAATWSLTRTSGTLAQEEIPITRSPFSVGRRSDNDLSVASSMISGYHAQLVLPGEQLMVRDLNSTNGTFVNGQEIREPAFVRNGDVIRFADVEYTVALRNEASGEGIASWSRTCRFEEVRDMAWLTHFDALLERPGVIPFGQPIIKYSDESVYAYEALARSTVKGLENPGAMFDAANKLNRDVELSILCRDRAIEASEVLPSEMPIFVNTHPAEDLQEHVMPSLKLIRSRFPQRRVVVEIHEGAVTDPASMLKFATQLREIGFELAYDDFGAGRTRFRELIEVPPDYMKFDAGFIRELTHASDRQLRMVENLLTMMRDVGTATLAEGVETDVESDICKELGFDYVQGYFFGRPADMASFAK